MGRIPKAGGLNDSGLGLHGRPATAHPLVDIVSRPEIARQCRHVYSGCVKMLEGGPDFGPALEHVDKKLDDHGYKSVSAFCDDLIGELRSRKLATSEIEDYISSCSTNEQINASTKPFLPLDAPADDSFLLSQQAKKIGLLDSFVLQDSLDCSKLSPTGSLSLSGASKLSDGPSLPAAKPGRKRHRSSAVVKDEAPIVGEALPGEEKWPLDSEDFDLDWSIGMMGNELGLGLLDTKELEDQVASSTMKFTDDLFRGWESRCCKHGSEQNSSTEISLPEISSSGLTWQLDESISDCCLKGRVVQQGEQGKKDKDKKSTAEGIKSVAQVSAEAAKRGKSKGSESRPAKRGRKLAKVVSNVEGGKEKKERKLGVVDSKLRSKLCPHTQGLRVVSRGSYGVFLKEGVVEGSGIRCDCCDLVLTPSGFVSHGGNSRKKPYEDLIVVSWEHSIAKHAATCPLVERAEGDEKKKRKQKTLPTDASAGGTLQQPKRKYTKRKKTGDQAQQTSSGKAAEASKGVRRQQPTTSSTNTVDLSKAKRSYTRRKKDPATTGRPGKPRTPLDPVASSNGDSGDVSSDDNDEDLPADMSGSAMAFPYSSEFLMKNMNMQQFTQTLGNKSLGHSRTTDTDGSTDSRNSSSMQGVYSPEAGVDHAVVIGGKLFSCTL